MATAHDAPTPQAPPPASAPNFVSPLPPGMPLWLLWGGAMLMVFALWLSKSYDELGSLSNVFWVLGLAAWAFGARQFWIVRKAQKLSDVTVLARQRRITGTLLLGVGIVLAGLTLYLGIRLGAPGFSIWVGLGLFTLVPLIAGLVLARPSVDSTVLVQHVLARHAILQNVLLLVGVLGVLVFLWLSFFRKVGLDYLPELSALLFESLLCATCAFWIISAQPSERTVFAFRCLLLIVGAGTGLILTLLAGVRALVWKQDVFGGILAWQSDAVGWKIWLCAYLGLVGLTLLFISVMLAQPEIRNHPTLRQSLYGYNAVAGGILLVAVLVTFNIIVAAMFPMTFEWAATRGGLGALHPASKSLLASLKEPTTVYVLMSQNHPLFPDIQSLMSNCQVQTAKLRVHYVSPDADFKEFGELALRYPEILPSARAVATQQETGGRGLLIVYGPEDQANVPHSFIAERKLWETPQQFDERRNQATTTLVFKGEVELMNELNFLIGGKKERHIYFLQGDEELDINARGVPRHTDSRDPMAKFGAERLVDRLKKDNYKVTGLSFGPKGDKTEGADNIEYLGDSDKKPAIPEGAYAVVIAGPSRMLTAECLNALGEYVDKKAGKLLITFDVVLDSNGKAMRKTGLETFLNKYGVEVPDQFVMRFSPPSDPREVVVGVPPDIENDLAKQFLLKPFIFFTTRVVKPAAAAPGKSKVETLLLAPRESDFGLSLVETNPQAVQFPAQYLRAIGRRELDMKPRFSRERLPVAVTVANDEGKPRMVVFGDTDFISNESLAPNEQGELNYSLFVSALEWMAERKGYLGPRARVSQTFSLGRDAPVARMELLPTWGMFLATVGLGLGIWLVRRR